MSQAQQWTMPARPQPGQFSAHDNFIVVNSSTRVAAESHFAESRANRARATLDEHNERCGHATRYEVLPIEKGTTAKGD
ncbi:hypothetical protein DIE18_04305 [Burkholderia sp. Bp9125]|nr:hypothetical protein DIE18_04305 [Burkholderia sp. Bp9125]